MGRRDGVTMEGEDGGRVAMILEAERFCLFVTVGGDGAALGMHARGLSEALEAECRCSCQPGSCRQRLRCHCEGEEGGDVVLAVI